MLAMKESQFMKEPIQYFLIKYLFNQEYELSRLAKLNDIPIKFNMEIDFEKIKTDKNMDKIFKSIMCNIPMEEDKNSSKAA